MECILKSKKQGILLIEVAVSLTIFLILSIAIYSFLMIGNKYFKNSKDSMKNSALIEAVRKELKYNLNLKEYKEKFYINKSNLNMDALKENNINFILATEHDGDSPYIEINICKTNLYEIKYLWKNGGDHISGEIYRKE